MQQTVDERKSGRYEEEWKTEEPWIGEVRELMGMDLVGCRRRQAFVTAVHGDRCPSRRRASQGGQ